MTQRPIKFRAWDTRNNRITYQVEATHGNAFNGTLSMTEIPVAFTTIHSDLILMQFTGLTDKSGKEIWEGDIVKEYNRLGDARTVVWDTDKGRWGTAGPMTFTISQTLTKVHARRYVEVIGNIYENPELPT